MLGLIVTVMLSHLCPTPTSWVERDQSGEWIHECGDEDGRPVGINGWTGDRLLVETILEHTERSLYAFADVATAVASNWRL